jgi:hypothetical protein
MHLQLWHPFLRIGDDVNHSSRIVHTLCASRRDREPLKVVRVGTYGAAGLRVPQRTSDTTKANGEDTNE